MSTSLRDNRTRRLTFDAMGVALAMMLSYLEVLLPLTAWIPLPGFRLGLANLAVLAAFVLLSPADAAVVSGIRICLSALLFGSVTSFFFSAMGGLLSFLTILAASGFFRKMSYLGVCVLSAAAHNVGQILAATVLFGSGVILSYLPVLLIASVGFGCITGTLMNLLLPRLEGRLRRGR